MAASPSDRDVDEVVVGIRAFGDLCMMIEVAVRQSHGETVSAPKLRTREGRFLYEMFVAPHLGLPVVPGEPLDPSRLDVSLQGLAKGDVASVRPYSQLSGFVDAFLAGSLDPCSEQYRSLMRVVGVYAKDHAEGRLLRNNPFDRRTA